jgi:hypothetical protein
LAADLALGAELADIICAELLTPPPNRFIVYEDASFRQKILDVSEADAETIVSIVNSELDENMELLILRQIFWR